MGVNEEQQALLSRDTITIPSDTIQAVVTEETFSQPVQASVLEKGNDQGGQGSQPILHPSAGFRFPNSLIADTSESSDAFSGSLLSRENGIAVGSTSRSLDNDAGHDVSEVASKETHSQSVGIPSPHSLHDEGDENSALVGPDDKGECRICQEEDLLANLETPCACSGSVKYAHRKCVQRWCNEKGNAVCEICHEPYMGGYTVAARRQLLTPEEIPAELREELALPFGQRAFLPRDSRVYAVRDGDRLYLEVEYEEYAAPNATGAAWCRSAALILLALLLMRHAFTTVGSSEDDDPGLFTLFLLRTIGILLPCYVMARAVSLLHRSNRDEGPGGVSVLDGSNVTVVLQPRQGEQARMARLPPSGAPLVQNQA